MTTPEPDRVLLEVVAQRLEDVRVSVAEIQRTQVSQNQQFVARNEWLLRNQHVDSTFTAHGREIGDLRAELRSRRLPWPSVVAAIGSIVAIFISLGLIS